jgi:selenide,water dikinase
MSVAGHKFYAPKGVGALVVRRGVPVAPLHVGAGQEGGRRPGTENVLSLLGLGAAAEAAVKEGAERMEHSLACIRAVYRGIHSALVDAGKLPADFDPAHFDSQDNVKVNGPIGRFLLSDDSDADAVAAQCLPNTLSISFRGVDAGTLVSTLAPTVAVSAGAACHSDVVELSAVLSAMQVPPDVGMGTLRLSSGLGLDVAACAAAGRRIAAAAAPYLPLSAPDASGQSFTVCPAPADGPVRLTQFAGGSGCGCKLRVQALERVLEGVDCPSHPDLVLGAATADDAAVIRVGTAPDLVHALSVDFFTPVCDDGYRFGQIAAANALSDLYAMLSRPTVALAVALFPSLRLDLTVLSDIMRGAADTCRAAGCALAGGHTVDAAEPAFGLCVLGAASLGAVKRNVGGKPGDRLILTKPLGAGIVLAAAKHDVAPPAVLDVALDSMATLNAVAAEVLSRQAFVDAVHGLTDVTGFGLCGHLLEMLRPVPTTEPEAAQEPSVAGLQPAAPLAVHARLCRSLPVLGGVPQLVAEFGRVVVPGAAQNNREWLESRKATPVLPADADLEFLNAILFDPETSGGLLAAVDPSEADALVAALLREGVPATDIGCLTHPVGAAIEVM